MKSFWISEVFLLLSVVDLDSVSCPIRNLRVTVDDYMKIYIDGVEKTNLPNADINDQVDVVKLPCTPRVVAIHGRNKPRGFPAGILASTDDDYVLTNSSWKCSNTSYKGWEQNNFDDSTWMSAVEFARGEHYLKFVNGIRPNAEWIWMRQWNGQFDSTFEEMDQDVYCRKRLGSSTGNESTSLIIVSVFFGVSVLVIIALISALWVLHLRKKTVKYEGMIDEGQSGVDNQIHQNDIDPGQIGVDNRIHQDDIAPGENGVNNEINLISDAEDNAETNPAHYEYLRETSD